MMPSVRILGNFRPLAGLGAFEYAWPENGKASATLSCESAAMVGWIPYYSREEDVPPGFLREAWSEDEAFRALLSTSNRPPNEIFVDVAHSADEEEEVRGKRGMRRFLELRHFRGAIALVKPTLYTGGGGKPVFLEFEALARPGYTQARPGHFLDALKLVEHFEGGPSLQVGDVSQSGDQVTIRLWLRMKIGVAGTVYSVLKTGKWPPWASLMIEFTFDSQAQRATVDYYGTAVPSQRRYWDWRRDSDYAMESELTRAGYEGFLDSGGCQNALAAKYTMDYPL